MDPENLKAVWDLGLDIKERSALHGGTNDINVLYGLHISTLQEFLEFPLKALKPGAEIHSVRLRMTLLHYAAEELGLPDVASNKPSDAVFKAIAKIPVKVMALNYDSLPCDMDELLRLIEEEKGH